MTIIQAIILGLIEGLTEFLPISSTAHLIIVGQWLGVPGSDFFKSFSISIQLGAILAVVLLYWRRIFSGWRLVGQLGAAFLPTAVIGFLLYSLIKSFLMDSLLVIALALLLGGLGLIIFEKYYQKKHPETESEAEPDPLNYRQAFLVGLFQSLAVVPGVSRAAATIVGGLSLGLRRRDIVEFSFLLAIPTMLAATAFDLYKTPLDLNGPEAIAWIVGFIVSFATAIAGIKFFLRFIKKNNFSPFGWYRLGLGIIILAWLWLK